MKVFQIKSKKNKIQNFLYTKKFRMIKVYLRRFIKKFPIKIHSIDTKHLEI
jgi:hypothetical protein